MSLADKKSQARGAKLAAARRAKNLTQQQAAEHLGVDRAAISRWERGSLPSADNLKALCDFYGVTVDSVLAD